MAYRMAMFALLMRGVNSCKWGGSGELHSVPVHSSTYWSCNGLDGKQTYDVKALLRSTVGDTFAYKFGLDGQETPTPAHSYSYWYGSDEDLHSPTATIGPQNYQLESLIFSVECHNYYTDCTIELQDLQMPDSAKNGNSTMTTTAMGPITVHNTSFRAVAGDGGPLACMYGNPRCGDCRADGVCPDVTESLCAPFGSDENAEQIMLESADACLAYAFGDQGDYVSNDAVQDASVGVPASMYGLMRVVFDEDSPIRSVNSTRNTSNGLPCYANPGAVCKKETVKGGLTGSTALDCINDAAFQCGESALEDYACEYLTAGVASNMCKSKYYGWAKSFVNSVVNKHIEEPIVHAATSFEEGCVNAAKSVGYWFASFF